MGLRCRSDGGPESDYHKLQITILKITFLMSSMMRKFDVIMPSITDSAIN